LFAAAKATPGSNQGHSSSTACVLVPISGNDGVPIKFLFLSAFFRDIKYFLCFKNGHVNLQMWVNELAFGSRKLKI
jgi:hypothetical protein